MKHCSQISLISLFVASLFVNQVSAKNLLLSKKVLSQHQEYKSLDEALLARLEDDFLKLYQDKDSAIGDFFDLTNYSKVKKRVNNLKEEVHGISKKNLGWGQFALAKDQTTSKIFLQVTHRFNDKDTLNIANNLWKNQSVKQVYANVVHRFTNRKKMLDRNSDFSTARLSPLLAATRAWLAFRSDGVIVQLHGFSRQKRISSVAKASNIIISHGINFPGVEQPILNSLKHCLQQSLKLTVAIYPSDVGELGGTQNVIAKEVKAISHYQQFLHLELDKSTRERLRYNINDSLMMFECVEKVYL